MKEIITVGMDMGDNNHRVCVLNAEGKILHLDTVTTTSSAIRKYFGDMEPCRISIEDGTHSGWVSRILEELGHEVMVGNPRKLRLRAEAGTGVMLSSIKSSIRR